MSCQTCHIVLFFSLLGGCFVNNDLFLSPDISAHHQNFYMVLHQTTYETTKTTNMQQYTCPQLNRVGRIWICAKLVSRCSRLWLIFFIELMPVRISNFQVFVFNMDILFIFNCQIITKSNCAYCFFSFLVNLVIFRPYI